MSQKVSAAAASVLDGSAAAAAAGAATGELKIRQAAEELGARGRRRHGGRGEEVAWAGDERVGVVGRRLLPRSAAAVARDAAGAEAAGRGCAGAGAGVGRGRCCCSRCPEDGAELVEPADAAGVEGQRREQPRRGGGGQRGRQRGQDARVPQSGAQYRREGPVVVAAAAEAAGLCVEDVVVRRRCRRGGGHGAPHGPLDGGEARGRGHGGGRRQQQLGRQERLAQQRVVVAAAAVDHHVVVCLALLRLRVGRRGGAGSACAGAREALHERHELAGLGVDDLGRRVVDDDGRPAPGLLRVVVAVVVPRPPVPLPAGRDNPRGPRAGGLLDGVRLHPDVEPGRARALQLPARRGWGGAARRRRRVHPLLRPPVVLRVGGGVGVAVVEERGAGIGPGMGMVQHERKGGRRERVVGVWRACV